MYTLFGTLIALGVLVTFHEFGHFWVARRCGIKVLRFSVGFGKPLVRWQDKHGTEFVIAFIPLGGYVKMLDSREESIPESLQDQAFNNKSVKQRIAVVSAGPIANFLLAFVLFWMLALIGYQEVRPIIGSVEPSSLAAQAGLTAGLEIMAVDQQPVTNWGSFAVELMQKIGTHQQLSIEAKPNEFATAQSYSVNLNGWLKGADEPNPIQEFGIHIWQPSVPAKIAHIQPDAPAAESKLLIGDTVLAINKQHLADWRAVSDQIKTLANQTAVFLIERDGAQLEIPVHVGALAQTPNQGFLGVAPNPVPWPEAMLRKVEFNPASAISRALQDTWRTSWMTLVSMKKIIVGELSVKNLSGPITIAKVAGSSAASGLTSFLRFLALLSISLGVLNLLPIPVLDGGHLLFYFIEWARGRPLSDKIQNFGMQIGILMILSVMLLAFFNDIMRL